MKEIQTIISKVSLVSFISFISLVSFVSLVSSCSKDDGFDEGQSINPASGMEIGGLSGYSTYFDEPDTRATRAGDALTRAWEIPSGYEAYEGGVQPIAIAFTQDGVNPKIVPDPDYPDPSDPRHFKSMVGHFFMVDDKWNTSVKIEADKEYFLYGFIPNLPVIRYDITDRNPGDDGDDDSNPETDSKYDGFRHGAIMSLQDVPTVMNNDFCVVIGAKHGYDKEHDGNSDGTNRLRQGDFSFTSSQGRDGDEKKDYVFLLFDHLYAALRVSIRVYPYYADLRTIKLKSLMLNIKEGEASKGDKTNITIRLHKTNGSNPSASPIDTEGGITFEEAGVPVTGDGMEFWSNKDGHTLTTAFQPFIGHFMPNGVTKLVLTSIYDVYDRKGYLIRKDCKATNSVSLSALYTGQTVTERGKRYTINMTIQPTYLYMLSEPDLDNPTVTVN